MLLLLFLLSNSHAQDSTPQALYRRGLLNFRQGRYVSARLDFNEIVTTHEDSPYITSAYMLLSKTMYVLGDIDEAMLTASRLKSSFPDSRYAPWTDYMISACLLEKGAVEQAAGILAGIVSGTSDDNLRHNALRALRYAIRPEMTDGRYAEILEDHGIDDSSFGDVQPYSDEEAILSPGEAPLPGEPFQPSDQQGGPSPTIGLLAPLTGAYAQQGYQLRMGVEASLRDHIENGGREVRLLVEDTASDPITAVMKTRKLVSDGAQAIIGPVYGESTIAAGVEANSLDIPFMAPTAQNSELTLLGPKTFQLHFNPVVQAEALADFALDSLSCENTAIVATQDQWGEAVSEIYAEKVKTHGVDILWTVQFDINEPNYTRKFIDIAMGLREHAPESTAMPESTIVVDNANAFPDSIVMRLDPTKIGPQVFPLLDTIDCILISAITEDAARIAQYISDYNLRSTFLGDSGWSIDDISVIGGPPVQGAFVVSPVAMHQPEIPVIHGKDLTSIISLKGYDAMSLLMRTVTRGDIPANDIVTALEALSDYRGLASRVTFGPGAHANTAIDFAVVGNGRYEPVLTDR